MGGGPPGTPDPATASTDPEIAEIDTQIANSMAKTAEVELGIADVKTQIGDTNHLIDSLSVGAVGPAGAAIASLSSDIDALNNAMLFYLIQSISSASPPRRVCVSRQSGAS